jgi:hypothetical protein
MVSPTCFGITLRTTSLPEATIHNWCICWFLRIFLLRILIFKGLTARRLYKSFGVKGLIGNAQSVIKVTVVFTAATTMGFALTHTIT